MNRADCERMDRDDPLAGFRDEFVLPADMIYFAGNSLGPPPRAAHDRALEVLDREWGEGLVSSWNAAGWFDLPVNLGNRIAPLVGAAAGEVVVTDSTGIDLYKVVHAALAMRPDRRVIVMEGSNFPTDNYMIQGLIAALGRGHTIRFLEYPDLDRALDGSVAAVCVNHVHYRTGRIHDMAAVTRRAHEAGALAVWDLCHSAGVLPVDLEAALADFAVGCTYKYLNGGPGSPAFLFVARRHHGEARQPLTGWWGHARPFAFDRDYRPAAGIRQMLSGTQPILSLAVAAVGIEMVARAGVDRIRSKSVQLTTLFSELVSIRCGGYGLRVISPADAAQRGSQIAIEHANGYEIIQALASRGVVGDFRSPECMRFGLSPLFLRHVDVWDAVDRLLEVLSTDAWRDPRYAVRKTVT
jgi:kynureninase